jgi:hypothetical protein
MSLDDIAKARAGEKVARATTDVNEAGNGEADEPPSLQGQGGGAGAGPSRRPRRKERLAAAAPLARPAPAATAVICNNCGGRGHIARNCPSAAMTVEAPAAAAALKCFGCGGPRKCGPAPLQLAASNECALADHPSLLM